MNEIRIFNHPSFGEIRTAGTPEEPMFCLGDVCRVLDLTVKGVNQRLDKGVISTYPLETAGGTQNALFVNEDGLYDVVLDSRKPEAKAFRKWVTSEVLPTIRRTGGYLGAGAEDTPEEIMAKALLLADRTMKDQKLRINTLEAENRLLEETQTENAPKVAFADALTASGHSILIGELAKILRQNGLEIGQNRLFERLRKEGYLLSIGERYNQPSQKGMEMGLFEMKTVTISTPHGSKVNTTTKVTPKGQSYFINRYITCTKC